MAFASIGIMHAACAAEIVRARGSAWRRRWPRSSDVLACDPAFDLQSDVSPR
jgi:hypothetical protein